MARTSTIYARVEPEVKEQAEQILDHLGISMSNAVGMFLRQVVLHRGSPFEMTLPIQEPLCYHDLSKEAFDAEIQKAIDSFAAGNSYPVEVVDRAIRQEFNL